MKPEIAKIWCDALESNEYEQGKEQLCFDEKYCCLGVLCELAIQNGVQVEKGEKWGSVTYNGTRISLPAVVREWAGIDSREGNIVLNDQSTCLSALNDEGKSFKEIARIIKDHAEEL